MTSELEKQFFDTFGIEPKILSTAIGHGFYIEHSRVEKYPQITDRILLELIRIIGLITIKYTNEQCGICFGDGVTSYFGKDLKEAILNFLISKVSIFKQQVRILFEEG